MNKPDDFIDNVVSVSETETDIPEHNALCHFELKTKAQLSGCDGKIRIWFSFQGKQNFLKRKDPRCCKVQNSDTFRQIILYRTYGTS